MLVPDQRAPDVKELAEFLVGKGLAKFKCPERVEVVDEFPLTRVGKIDKPALRARIADVLKKEQEAIRSDADRLEKARHG
jgi:non-ribosomal peptide synthetase component E (peptide arylation enzyme)